MKIKRFNESNLSLEDYKTWIIGEIKTMPEEQLRKTLTWLINNPSLDIEIIKNVGSIITQK